MERRSKVRFPVIEAARYQLRNQGRVLASGFGQIVNFSSSGTLLRVQESFAIGDALDMTVDWPVARDGRLQMTFQAHAHVVRVEPGTIALNFSSHEFRIDGPADALRSREWKPGPKAELQDTPAAVPQPNASGPDDCREENR